MIQRKNNFLLICFCTLFFSCGVQTQEKDIKNHYDIVFVESIYNEKLADDIENVNQHENNVEKLIAVFSKKKDSVTTYDFGSNMESAPIKNLFTSKKIKKETRIYTNFKNSDPIQVVFKGNNMIKIDLDLYTLNKPYYDFLKREILDKGSVLEFANLIKHGYGDYSMLFRPLIDYKWTKKKPNSDYKIENVLVYNVNYQSSEEKPIPWEVIYNGTNIKGKRFNKVLIKTDSLYNVYKIETTDERSDHKKLIYENRSTTLDSIVGSWVLYSTNKTYKYINYQSKLKVVSVLKKPKNSKEVIDSLKKIK